MLSLQNVWAIKRKAVYNLVQDKMTRQDDLLNSAQFYMT